MTSEPTLFDSFPCLCIWRRTAARIVAFFCIVVTIFMLVISADKYNGHGSNFSERGYDGNFNSLRTEKEWHQKILIGGSIAVVVHFLLFFGVTIFSKILVLGWAVWSALSILLLAITLIVLRSSEDVVSLAIMKPSQYDKLVSWFPIVYGITSPIGPLLSIADFIANRGQDNSRSTEHDPPSDYTIMYTTLVFSLYLFLVAAVLGFCLEMAFLKQESKELEQGSKELQQGSKELQQVCTELKKESTELKKESTEFNGESTELNEESTESNEESNVQIQDRRSSPIRHTGETDIGFPRNNRNERHQYEGERRPQRPRMPRRALLPLLLPVSYPRSSSGPVIRKK